MAQKAKKEETLLKLDYLLAEGVSLGLAADRAGMSLVEAMNYLKTKQLQRDMDPIILSMIADKALEEGIKGLLGIVQTCMIPAIRLGAAQELVRLGLAAKKMTMELDAPVSNSAGKSTNEGSHWRFSSAG